VHCNSLVLQGGDGCCKRLQGKNQFVTALQIVHRQPISIQWSFCIKALKIWYFEQMHWFNVYKAAQSSFSTHLETIIILNVPTAHGCRSKMPCCNSESSMWHFTLETNSLYNTHSICEQRHVKCMQSKVVKVHMTSDLITLNRNLEEFNQHVY